MVNYRILQTILSELLPAPMALLVVSYSSVNAPAVLPTIYVGVYKVAWPLGDTNTTPRMHAWVPVHVRPGHIPCSTLEEIDFALTHAKHLCKETMTNSPFIDCKFIPGSRVLHSYHMNCTSLEELLFYLKWLHLFHADMDELGRKHYEYCVQDGCGLCMMWRTTRSLLTTRQSERIKQTRNRIKAMYKRSSPVTKRAALLIQHLGVVNSVL